MEEKRDFTFMREQVKERPLDKRKLLRKTGITAAMAVVFGLIACITFLVLKPLVENWLYPKEEIKPIEITEDAEEMLPQDMLVHEETVLDQREEVINTIKNEIKLDTTSYGQLYESLYALTRQLESSMVTVTCVSQEIDWLNDPYETKGQTTGFLLADNNRELTILVVDKKFAHEEEFQVTFINGEQKSASLKGMDEETGLVILSVDKEEISAATLEKISFIHLGRTLGIALTGSPVIAVGRPLGNRPSVIFGMITSEGTTVSLTEANYELLTTDIYGGLGATGLLVDLQGQVIGVIHQEHNDASFTHLVSAIGITELKAVLQRMANGLEKSYLGIKGTDVPEEARRSLDIPQGAYVTGIVMGSPAMAAGIQSGDIVVSLGIKEIRSFNDYTEAVRQIMPGELAEIVVMRKGQQTYRKVELTVTMGKAE